MTSTADVDGRRLRRDRNREAVVEAIIAMLHDGMLDPDVQEIAARAAVSPRTVFRHFDDLDSLFAEVVDRQLTLARPLFDAPIADGSRAARIEGLVAHRSTLYEAIAPVRRAAVVSARFHAPVRAGLEWSHAYLRAQVERTFEPELRSARGARRTLLIEALDVATSWHTWNTLRSEQGLDPEVARRVVVTMLSRLL